MYTVISSLKFNVCFICNFHLLLWNKHTKTPTQKLNQTNKFQLKNRGYLKIWNNNTCIRKKEKKKYQGWEVVTVVGPRGQVGQGQWDNSPIKNSTPCRDGSNLSLSPVRPRLFFLRCFFFFWVRSVGFQFHGMSLYFKVTRECHVTIPLTD